MNPLQLRLAALRRRLRLLVSVRGACCFLAFLAGCAIVAGFLDWLAPLPSLIRALFLVGTLAGAGFLAYRFLILPLGAKADDLSLALRVETRYPDLNDALASTIQFLEESTDAEWAGSPSLRREAVQQTMRKVQKCDFNKVVNSRGLRPAGLAFVTAAALSVILLFAYPQLVWTALARLGDPFGEHDWPTQTQIEVAYKSLVPAGQPFQIRATLTGVLPQEAVIDLEGHSASRLILNVSRDEKAGSGQILAKLDMTRQQGDFRFRVRANDAVSPRKPGTWYKVSVAQAPELETLQVRLYYPAYTGLTPEDLPGGYENVEAVLGTRLRLQGTLDRGVTRAWIQFQPLTPQLYAAALAVPLAAQSPLESLTLSKNSQEAWSRIPVTLTDNGKHLAADFVPRFSGNYHLTWEDDMGLGQRRSFAIKVNPDPAPDVKLECLSLFRNFNQVAAGAVLSLQITATDPEYGVKAVYLEYRRRNKDGKDLDDDWHSVPLYDNQDLGRMIPQMVFSGLAGLPVPLTSSPLPLRSRRLVLLERWPLQGLVEEGNILLLRAAADDYDDVSPGKQPGRSSPPLELKIVSAEEMKPIVQEAMRQVRDDVTRVNEMQENAHKKVAAAEQQLRTTGKLRPEEANQLADARDIQKQIQERIGKDKEEGLQKDVDRARRMLEDNQLARSSANDQMDNVARALRRMTTETDQLNKIQDLLEKARKAAEENEGKPRPGDRNNPDLTQARREQEEVQKTLEGLLADLTPYVRAQEMQGKTRALLQEQQELEKISEGLRKELKRYEDNKLDKGQKEQLKADLQKAAERQQRLAERARQVLDEMRQVLEKRKESDPDMAKTLEKAVDEANKVQVTKQMDEAANALKPGEDPDKLESKIGDAAEKQQGSSEALRKVLQALEERREDELDRLSKRQQRELDKLDDLQDRLRKLQKEVQAANQIKDDKLRRKKLQELAEEQKRIREDVDQMVKRLSRAQAHEAAQQLRRASRNMEESAKQMDDGEDPEQQQRNALERLNDAAKELEQANNRVERELARLKQAKLADEIKLLKRRQDAGIEEMIQLHKELLEKKQWERALTDRLSGLRLNRQNGLETDTATLTKKIAEAEVFSHILKKTSKAMKEAANRMKKRLRTAVDERSNRPLTDEEIADENKGQRGNPDLPARGQPPPGTFGRSPERGSAGRPAG
jgi:hypothetical protein